MKEVMDDDVCQVQHVPNANELSVFSQIVPLLCFENLEPRIKPVLSNVWKVPQTNMVVFEWGLSSFKILGLE